MALDLARYDAKAKMIHTKTGRWASTELRTCACGCGQHIKSKGRFINGHNKRREVPWNKGLTKDTDERVAKYAKGISESLKGHTPWNKGKIGVMPTSWNKGVNPKHSKKCECGCGEFTSPGKEYVNSGHARRGTKCSKETKEKMSKSRVGIVYSEETKKRISEGHIGVQAGDKHPNWRGGISNEPYCDVWADKEYKEDIRERDGYVCQNPECWGDIKEGEKLSIHHTDYNKKNCHPSNLITLCRSCNSRANVNRDYWKELYSGIVT